jgi:cyclopropane-fatty-acyl-phospholipid synthase
VRASIERSLRLWRTQPAATRFQGKADTIQRLKRAAIATEIEAANQQHYEVPSRFFQQVLGPRLKYSSCYWPVGVEHLEDAEEAMLELTCQRAQIEDGMRLLDLGCGWGSLSLWLAEKYPQSHITAISNSNSQRRFITQQAANTGLSNIEVFTANVAEVNLDQEFDRVLAIEMFEHMKNYQRLLARIAQWLRPDGKLFVHHFSHRQQAYEFDSSPRDYMGHTYFAGGTMPSHDLLFHFQEDLRVERHWQVNGRHYARTLQAWLHRLDERQEQVLNIFQNNSDQRTPRQWLTYWRNFFIICEETFKIHAGNEYFVSHLLMSKGKPIL